MSMLDAATTRKAHPNTCWAHQLPPDLAAELAAVEAAVADGTPIVNANVTRYLQAHGVHVSGSVVDRHFRGECRCSR